MCVDLAHIRFRTVRIAQPLLWLLPAAAFNRSAASRHISSLPSASFQWHTLCSIAHPWPDDYLIHYLRSDQSLKEQYNDEATAP